MDREEAIAILQEEIDGNLELTLREWRERDEQKLFPALRMAIEALSAEQKEEELAKDIARRMATIIENEQDMRVILKNASAEPTDLISRTDALEQMAQAECGLHYEDCEADNCACDYIWRILNIPSADRQTELLDDGTLKVNVQNGAEVNRVLVWGDDGCGGLYYADDRPSGEWIYDGVKIASDEESRPYWKCSECGHEGNPDANYCEFCGAKMGSDTR